MAFWEWISQNWFDLFGSAGVAGLWFTVVSLREETKARRVSNRIGLTENHRALWSECFHNRQLLRVLDASVDLSKDPITIEEEIFVGMAIQQLHATCDAIKSGLTINPEGICHDIWSFFSLPIPKTVWAKAKSLQNHDFVAFVESCLGGK